MGRGLLWVTCVLTACVATNPAWDGPVDVASDSSQTGDRVGTESGSDSTSVEATSVGEGDGSAALSSEGTSLDETTSAEASSSDVTGNTTDPTACPEGERICDGACTDVSQDKHACSNYCIDCTVLFGNNAQCDNGLCRYHGQGGSGSGGGDG